MNNFFSRNKYPVLLALVGLILFLSVYGLMDIGSQAYRFPDSLNYAEAAARLYMQGLPHYFRPLGMAAIYGLPYLFGSHGENIFSFSIYINLLCWLGSAQLIFALLKKFISPRNAFFAAAVFYILPGVLFNSYTLLTESIYTFMVLLSFYFISKYYSRQSYRYLAWAIALLLFTMLIKPGAKFFSILIIIYYIRVIWRNYRKPANLFIVGSIALIITQCAMIKQEYGDFTITYIDGVTYYNYMGAKANLIQKGEIFNPKDNPRSEYLRTLPYHEQKQLASADMAQQLKTNKAGLFKAYVNNLYVNSSSGSPAIDICKRITYKNRDAVKALFRISKVEDIMFTVAGLLLALYYFFELYKKESLYGLMGMFILYTFALSGVSSNEGDRFHIVFYPLVIILAAKFCPEKLTRKKNAL